MDTVPPDRDPEKGFARVSAERPCPVCRKPDYCLVAADGTGRHLPARRSR